MVWVYLLENLEFKQNNLCVAASLLSASAWWCSGAPCKCDVLKKQRLSGMTPSNADVRRL